MITFMKVKLNPGIKPINLITYFIVYFFFMSVFIISTSFVPFILSDSKYYNVPDTELGSDLGEIGSICEGIVIV